MKFKDFDQDIQDIPHTVIKDWEIEVPFDIDYKPIIAKARKHMVLSWHVKVGDPTNKNPKPVTKMWWDDGDKKTS